jgi:5-aminolevulinate synthase
MGPALDVRSKQIAAGYASVAAPADVQKMHQEKGYFPSNGLPAEEDIAKCPHASAARAAAKMADDLAAAATNKQKAAAATPAAAGCPFHQAAAASAGTSASAADKLRASEEAKAATRSGFDYEQFYTQELEKKHNDKSYRYFNNINRLASKFPVAHTGNVKEEVEVWCANDYLGMGSNPVVLETMQYVIRGFFYTSSHEPKSLTHDVCNQSLLFLITQPDFGQIWSRRWWHAQHCR